MSDKELNLCPCGRRPEKLIIYGIHSGTKWAFVMGSCCNEWSLEFPTEYNKFDTDDCMNLAVEYWNDATRSQQTAG